MKKINALFSVLITFVLCIMTVNAASDKLQIVASSGEVVNLGEAGGIITKSIVAEDLENGIITIEAKIKNSKSTEIFFVVDNSTEFGGLENVKTNVITAAKALVGNIHDNLANIKTGLLVMHPNGLTPTEAENGGLISALSADKTTTLAAFDTLTTETPVENGQDFLEVLETAGESFNETAENKIIVLVLAGVNGAGVASYKTAMLDMANNENVTFITVLIENSEAYKATMFGTEETPTTGFFHDIDTDAIATTFSTNVNANILSTLPTDKFNVLFEDLFPEIIVDNFTIEYVGSPSKGAVGDFNREARKFSWSVGDLEGNIDATFQYRLKLNSTVPASAVDKAINTNTGINFSYTGASAQLYECSPTIKILITNPKTGVYDYFIPAALIFCISVLTISIIKRRDMFIPI